MIKTLVFTPVFIAAVSLFVFSCIKVIRKLKLGKKPDNRITAIKERVKTVLTVAFGQTKLMRDFPAGILHFFIFWGFILFLFAVKEAILQGFFPKFTFAFTGYFYSVITLVQDIFGLLIIFAVFFAFYRRFVQKIPRLIVDSKGSKDAVFILSMILLVVISMFGQNVNHVLIHNFHLSKYELRPVSLVIAKLFTWVGNPELLFEVFWWMHLLVIFTFMNYLPYSKHLHVLTSIPNTFLANEKGIRNTLKKINLDDENADVFGASDIEHFSWKQILDGYTCTECGRCTAACPAANAGKLLSPRKIITDIRHRADDLAPIKLNGLENAEISEKTLVHNYISDTELWQCTTCMACVQECPVMIEHVDSIVDMRRYLVLSESNFPSELNSVFKNLETNYTPWAFNQADRANWAEGMNIKTLAEDNSGEVLFWVGCAGSFDARYQKVTKAFAQIMQKAGVDFRILGTEEKCNGDTARRLGNEYLAQMMMQENIETLNNYNVKKIVTACPHCFHSIGNEYKQFGGNFEVVHHSEFISKLISDGKIKLKESLEPKKLTYHDSCYLGRYNENYEAPRRVISESTNSEIIEMKKNKSRGMCCGAGGGRMFLEDEEGGRINIERTKEVLETGAETVASACPFCMTMLTDGIKHFNKNDDIFVKDIAEIVFENINQ